MLGITNNLIDNGMQCWTCPIFDRLFEIISNSAAAAYSRLTFFSVIIFTLLLAVYILSIVWDNMKQGGEDPLFQNTLRPVLIKSLIALSLLGAGLLVPKLISTAILEPTAEITYQFSQSMLPETYTNVPTYTSSINIGDDSFFTKGLRDTIIKILNTSVSNFQVYVTFGINIIDQAFSVRALLGGIAVLVRHIIIFFIGLFLTYYFGKWFIKYSFCFIDIIVAMAMFAFFFPLSVVLFIFKDANKAPEWMKKLGSDLGTGQIKKLVNAIISVAATILTYSIMIAIIGEFLNLHSDGLNSSRSLFDFDLDHSTAMETTIAGTIVLVYVVNYISDQTQEVAKKILSVFGLSKETPLSDEMGENTWKLTNLAFNQVKGLAKTIINPDETKKDTESKNTDDKKTETKEEKK